MSEPYNKINPVVFGMLLGIGLGLIIFAVLLTSTSKKTEE